MESLGSSNIVDVTGTSGVVFSLNAENDQEIGADDKELGHNAPVPTLEGLEVKLNPIVLLEDCNKERLLDFKKRQWLRNFVLNGNMNTNEDAG